MPDGKNIKDTLRPNTTTPIPADLKVPTFKDLYGMEPEAVPGMKK